MEIKNRADLEIYLEKATKDPEFKKLLEKNPELAKQVDATLSDVSGGATAIEYGLIAALLNVAILGVKLPGK